MAIGNLLLLTQVTVYLVALVFSVFAFVPLAVNRSDFHGHCALHATGVWHTTPTVPMLNVTSWGATGNCGFPLFVGSVSLPLSLVLLLSTALYLFKGTTPSWCSAMVSMGVLSVVSLFHFIGAVLLASGVRSWCLLLQQEYKCSDAEETDFLGNDDSISTRHFYMQFAVAQFGAWVSFVCWFVQLLCSFLQLLQYHQDEDFRVSASRERQRLLQRFGSPADMAI